VPGREWRQTGLNRRSGGDFRPYLGSRDPRTGHLLRAQSRAMRDPSRRGYYDEIDSASPAARTIDRGQECAASLSRRGCQISSPPGGTKGCSIVT